MKVLAMLVLLAGIADAQPTPQKISVGIYAPSVELGASTARLAYVKALAGNPPESLVDLGIVYDMIGRPKDAYDTWVRAKARGVTAPGLQRWIDAKKRIYGY